MPDMMFSLTGFKETDALFKNLTHDAQTKAIKAGLLQAFKPIKALAIANTPKDTGRLKESIHLAREFRTTGFVLGTLGYRTRGGKGAPHAHLIEYGTQERTRPITRFTITGGKKVIGQMNVGKIKRKLMMTRAFKQSGGAAAVRKTFIKELNLSILRSSRKAKNRKSKLVSWF